MKRTLEEGVVDFLSFSQVSDRPTADLTKFSASQWERCLKWMDDSGLALYFLQAAERATDPAPHFVMESLRRRLDANRQRVASMERQFRLINQRFETANIKFAAVKGLALVPEFCPNPSLRHQSDFDYLVDQPSLKPARSVLEDMGYFLHEEWERELILVLPSDRKPARGEVQYDADAPHSVELHLSIVAELGQVAWEEPPFLENAVARRFQGSTYPALNDEDAFMLQCIHAFHHILIGWIKLSWLYEIGYFVERHEADRDFWERVSQNLTVEPLLREAIAVIVCLASQVFGAPIPLAIKSWIEAIRPSVRTWIENYSWHWLFGHNLAGEFAWFPTSKLVLFLHQQYIRDPGNDQSVARSRLLPLRGINRIKHKIRRKPSLGPVRYGRLIATEFRRVIHHLGSDLRYLWEVPRWRRLSRACGATGSTSISSGSNASDL